jgi:hypothetical protein
MALVAQLARMQQTGLVEYSCLIHHWVITSANPFLWHSSWQVYIVCYKYRTVHNYTSSVRHFPPPPDRIFFLKFCFQIIWVACLLCLEWFRFHHHVNSAERATVLESKFCLVTWSLDTIFFCSPYWHLLTAKVFAPAFVLMLLSFMKTETRYTNSIYISKVYFCVFIFSCARALRWTTTIYLSLVVQEPFGEQQPYIYL